MRTLFPFPRCHPKFTEAWYSVPHCSAIFDALHDHLHMQAPLAGLELSSGRGGSLLLYAYDVGSPLLDRSEASDIG